MRTLLILAGVLGLHFVPSYAGCRLVNVKPPRVYGKTLVGRTLHVTHGVWRCER